MCLKSTTNKIAPIKPLKPINLLWQLMNCNHHQSCNAMDSDVEPEVNKADNEDKESQCHNCASHHSWPSNGPKADTLL